jgi:hypothetical protein
MSHAADILPYTGCSTYYTLALPPHSIRLHLVDPQYGLTHVILTHAANIPPRSQYFPTQPIMSHSATAVLTAATSYSVEGQAGKQGRLLTLSQGTKPLPLLPVATAVSVSRVATTAAAAARPAAASEDVTDWPWGPAGPQSGFSALRYVPRDHEAH